MNIIVTYVIAGVIHYEEHKDTLTDTVGESGELNIVERNGDTSRTYAPGVWKTIDYRDAP